MPGIRPDDLEVGTPAKPYERVVRPETGMPAARHGQHTPVCVQSGDGHVQVGSRVDEVVEHLAESR